MASEHNPVWNLGTHFNIVRGNCIGDNDDYFNDGFYLDASQYKSTIEGTLHYWRSYRNDGRDYMTSFKNSWGNFSA